MYETRPCPREVYMHLWKIGRETCNRKQVGAAGPTWEDGQWSWAQEDNTRTTRGDRAAGRWRITLFTRKEKNTVQINRDHRFLSARAPLLFFPSQFSPIRSKESSSCPILLRCDRSHRITAEHGDYVQRIAGEQFSVIKPTRLKSSRHN